MKTAVQSHALVQNTHRHITECPIIYMEVYSSNRVIYRVTAGYIVKQGSICPTYGVMLEEMRTGEMECIEDFSESLELTIRFANDLVGREIRPAGLYDIAFAYLSEQATGQVLSSRKIFSR